MQFLQTQMRRMLQLTLRVAYIISDDLNRVSSSLGQGILTPELNLDVSILFNKLGFIEGRE